MKKDMTASAIAANRRQFLGMGLALGAGMALLGPTAVLAAPDRTEFTDCASAHSSVGYGPVRIQDTRVAMGTFVTMTAISDSKDRAGEAIDLAFSEIRRLSAILDRHAPDTPLAWLNNRGILNDPAPELLHVVRAAAKFHALSDGAFDMSVLPLMRIFEQETAHGSSGTLPKSLVKEALSVVDSESVRTSPRWIRFNRQGMGITLDGIAKGYIVDCASSILRDHGIADHLINAGGDIRASQGKFMKRPWVVAIEDPAKQGRRPDVIALSNGAVATSGGYEIFNRRNRACHHVVTPTIGTSPSQIISASVAASTVMEADALSTSVLILGPRRGVSLLDSLSGRDGFVVAANGASAATQMWPSLHKRGNLGQVLRRYCS